MKMKKSVLDVIRGRIAERRSQAATEQTDARGRFFALVRESIAGKEVDPDEVESVTVVAGFELEHFEQFIAREEERARLAATVSEKPELERLIAENTAKFETLREEIRRTIEAWQKRESDLITEQTRLRYEYPQLLHAEQQLARFPNLEDPLRGITGSGRQLASVAASESEFLLDE